MDNFLTQGISDSTKRILSSIGDGVIVTDGAAAITFLNAAAEVITGWSVAEAIGQDFNTVFSLYHSKTQKAEESPVDAVLRSQKAIGLKAGSVLITREGKVKYLSANCTPLGSDMAGAIVVFRDITRYLLLEQQIKEEDANLRAIFNSAPVGMVITDAESTIVEANDTALIIFEVQREALIGQRIGDGLGCKSSSDTDHGCGFGLACSSCEMRYLVHNVFGGLGPSEVEFEKTFVCNSKEHKLWFRVSSAAITLSGKPLVLLTFMDITDSKNKHIALAESLDFFMGVFANFPTIIFRSNNSNFTYLSGNWREITGQPVPEALELGWMKHLHPDDRQRYEENLHAFSEDAKNGKEIRIWHRDGKYRWAYVLERPYYNIDGVQEGCIGMAFDITDRKTAEAALERYKLLSQGAQDIILFLDKNGIVLEANEASVKAYGYSREELLNKTIFDLRDADKRTVCRQIDQALARAISFEAVHLRKDGTKFPVEINSYSEIVNGRTILVSIIRDISERKRAEAALKQAKDSAEAANKAKSEFLANMSHEIRTPINGVMGMVDLTLLTELDAEQKENLITAKYCAMSLLELINDILDFSKIEAGKLFIDNTPFDLRDLIEQIVKTHANRAVKKGLELNCVLSSAVPRYVTGDPARLRQVLTNLIDNAIKFTEEGTVTLVIKNEGGMINKNMILFSVADTGIGIEQEHQRKLFKTFSQVDGSITRKFGGTGLGLAISQRIVIMMGGQITVESKINKGSTFQFSVPLMPARAPVASVQKIGDSSIQSRHPQKILLVEDDAINRKVTMRMLKEMGHAVESATNGKEALTMLNGVSIDLILMDIYMPEMDGIETTQRIREMEKHTYEHIPIIALTAHALLGDRERFLAAGMDDYLSKPTQLKELFQKIEEYSLKHQLNGMTNAKELVTARKSEAIAVSEVMTGSSRSSNLQTAVKLVNKIAKTIALKDAEAVERAAHKLKEVANLEDDDAIKNAAFKIELAARRGNLEEGGRQLKKLKELLRTYQSKLKIT